MNSTTDWLGLTDIGGAASTTTTHAITWPPFLRG